ncbi:MAG TPA: glycosyltransferase family 39 protein [Candidatus Saccharimonadales bacterium]|nr:glycosyltransferase family 39 protein [Candidatus Saccharimonadales bacterium]
MRKASFPDLLAHWRPLLISGGGLLAIGMLLCLRLGTLLGGYAPQEFEALQNGRSFLYIFHHPINAPFTIMVRLLLFVTKHHQLLAVRLAATICGAATLLVFFLLVRHWHGLRTAFFGTVLFASAPWFLHVARLGTPDVMLFGALALVAWGTWLKQTGNPLVLLAGFMLATGLLYVPGMLWIVAAGVLWQWKTIDRVFQKNLWAVTLGGLVFLAALIPLGLAIYHAPALAKVVAGLPAQGWPQILPSLHRLADVPFWLFVHGPADPLHWLGRLAVLDAFAMAMAALGVYLYTRHIGLTRARILLTMLALGAALLSLGGQVSLTLIVPFVYLLAAAGVGFLLDRWYLVFPRNTIAQSVGIGLISLAVLASCWYGISHYFVAWPGAPETKATFTVPPSVTIEQ